jgi:Uma2 family endonuclease
MKVMGNGIQLVVDDVDAYAPVVLHSPPMSEEEFIEFCEKYEDFRIEYDAPAEEIIIMPPTDEGSSFRNSDITRQLGNWARRDGRGRVYDSSGGVLLPNGSRRSADAAWVEKARVKEARRREPRRSWPVLCPDFVIELRSPSDRLKQLRAKMEEWIENGAQLGWLINARNRTVTIYRPGREPEVLTNPDRVEGEGPVKGFVLEMAEIWLEA